MSSKNQSKLEMTLSDEVAELLRRAQDLECQRTKKPVSLAETLKNILTQHLEKHDPVKKAERARPAKKSFPQERKKPIPAAVRHAVVRRDQNRCQYPGCGTSRWVELHHAVPRSRGGQNTVENLLTLCDAHHRHAHTTGKCAHSSR